MALTSMPPPAVPPPRTSNREEDSMNQEPSQSGKSLIGIIYPPPEIRNIVDKTASFVARNGVEFENRIRANEQGNAKFKFLDADNPYHAYYQSKVKEFKEGVTTEPSIPKPTLTQRFQTSIKQEFIPKEPPPDPEFMAEPATINAYDLDLIKMTALFCARNGRHFMTQLMNREARNYQFDFLKPQHSNFPYFTKLVEQYTKVLLPPKNVVQKLETELNDPSRIIEDVKYRVAWFKHQKRLREKEEAAAERERQAYASIDWHDFVVVQTVDFQPNETQNLPPPCTPRDVGARILAQARIEMSKQAAVDIEMEMEDSDEEQEAVKAAESAAPESNGPAPPKPPEEEVSEAPPEPPKAEVPPTASAPIESLKVRRDYNPKATKQVESLRKEEKWVISPLTGEKIPADKLSEHMRYNTVDQQYFAQKEKERTDRAEESVFAQGVEVGMSIRALAERRSDIFGVGSKGAEQTIVGEKLGGPDANDPPPRDPRTIWDGWYKTMEATKEYVRSKITVEQQLEDIQRITGVEFDTGKGENVPGGSRAVPSSMSDKSATSARGGGERPKGDVTTSVTTPGQVDQRGIPIEHPNQLQVKDKEGNPGFQMINPSRGALSSAGTEGKHVVTGAINPNPHGPKVVPVVINPLLPNFQPTFVQHRVVVPGPVPGMAQSMQQQPPPPNMPEPEQPAPPTDEPPNKRSYKPDEPFVPEDVWLAAHAGVQEFSVQMPRVDDKPEWNCNGQQIQLRMDSRDTMAMLKEKVAQMTNMPVSKQKPAVEGIFVKDSNTIAYYNMCAGKVVVMHVKERGGKKK